MGCICECHDWLKNIGVNGCCFKCEAEHDPLRNALSENAKLRDELARLTAYVDTLITQAREMERQVGAANRQVEEYRKVLEGLFVAVPAIGHHDLPAYACPAHDLAQAMNAAAKKLNKPEPYPGARVVEKPKPETIEDLLGECRECNRLQRDCGNHGPLPEKLVEDVQKAERITGECPTCKTLGKPCVYHSYPRS